MRYLTSILLFYHAQFRINALHNAFNRSQLDILLNKPANSEALNTAQEFQKSFDLFQSVINNTYQLRALVVGGPLIALLSFLVSNFVLPFATHFFGSLGSWIPVVSWIPGEELNVSIDAVGLIIFNLVFVGAVAIWVMVSAWMDMQSILINLDMCSYEQAAFAATRTDWRRKVPVIDLLGYLVVIAFFGVDMLWYVHHVASDQNQPPVFQQVQFIAQYFYGVEALLLISMGVIALCRRVRLNKDIALTNPQAR